MKGIDRMREEDIRPGNLVRENTELLAEDTRKVLKHKNRFVEIPCPACESSSYGTVFEKDGFKFVCCHQCETVFVNPRPTFEMLTKFYTTSRSAKHWNNKVLSASESNRRSQISAPRARRVVELCSKHNVTTGVLLDAGAGFGTFCEEVKKLAVFDKVIAVEPSHDLAETCRHKGLEVIEKPIEEVGLNGMSVVTNFELIEHLSWPKDFLSGCCKALHSGGLLVVTTLNIKGFDLLVLGKLSDNIGGPSHLNYFHLASLSQLLNECGFEVLESLTPGKLDAELVRKKVLNGELDISTQPFIRQALINDWEKVGDSFQKFLADNKLSSHMWLVARKR